jgi:hypothetical protein
LSKDFVESIGLLDTQKTNTKDQKERQRSHNDPPYTHCKKEEGYDEVDNVSSTKGEQGFSNFGVFQTGNHWRWSFNGDTHHYQTDDCDQTSHQHIQISRSHSKMNGHRDIELFIEKKKKIATLEGRVKEALKEH